MHYNTLFQERNLKKKFGRGTAPPETPPHWGGRNPSPDTTPPPRRLGRLDRRAFDARFLCVPYFQCRLLATLTVTNVVQGKRSKW